MLDWHSCQTCYPLEKKLLLLLYYVRLEPACAATEKLVRGLKFRIYKAKQKYMCVSGFILRKNRVGRSDLIFIFF